MTRLQFVADHSPSYDVKLLCQMVGVARSSFYHWQATAPARAARAGVDAVLATQIRAVHAPRRAPCPRRCKGRAPGDPD